MNTEMIVMLLKGVGETLYMTLAATGFSYLFGLPVGVFLVITDKDGIRPMVSANRVVGLLVNFLRSVPFLVLIVAVIPITRFIVGKAIGSTATLVPLTIGAAPFIARMVESSLKEVDKGVVEAAQSMGATVWDIIRKVLLPEAKPSLIVGSVIALTTILSYSAIAGVVGGGGLGAIAINYGYYRYQTDIMFICMVILVLIVQIFQEIGMKTARALDKRL